MARRWRRRVAIPLTALAVGGLTSGCVVTRNSFHDTASSKRSITVWTYLNDPVLNPALDAVWRKAHPDVAVKRDFIDLSELPPKLVAAAATGSGPDVIIGNPVVDYPLVEGGGAYADITDRVNAARVREQYPSYGLWTTKGRVHALQWRFNNLGLWYNRDLLQRYHLPVPTTVAQMQQDMAIAHQKSHGTVRGIGMSADSSVQSAWQMMTWLLGDGVNYCSLDSPQTERTLTMLRSWKDRGWTGSGIAAEGMEDVFADFLRGDYLFAEGGNWEVGTVAVKPPAFHYGTTEIPRGKAGSFTSFAGESVALGEHSHQKDLAWDYIRTVYLSGAGQTATFKASGALPPRLDTRQTKPIRTASLSQPFLAELTDKRLKPWPDNSRTLDAQNDVGTAWSDLMAGSTTPKQAADQIRAKVHDEFAEGTGGC